MSIYSDIILDHYQYPRNKKNIKDPTKGVHVDNPLCGDSLDMKIRVVNGKVEDIGYTGKGCAISIASASLLSEYVKGRDVKELSTLKSDFVIGLLHIELTPNRLKCALLPWEALMKLITI